MYISGAKFEEHRFNISRDILDWVLYFKVKNDHRSKFSNLSNWKEEAWKNQGFKGIRTRDLRDTLN